MLKNIKIFLNQLSAATDRICSLQEEQQQLREQNELIRERSEKSVEVRAVSQLGSWFLCRVHLRSPQISSSQFNDDLGLRMCKDILFDAITHSHVTPRPPGPLGVSQVHCSPASGPLY